jgi:hypothetical protein
MNDGINEGKLKRRSKCVSHVEMVSFYATPVPDLLLPPVYPKSILAQLAFSLQESLKIFNQKFTKTNWTSGIGL